MTIYIPDKLKNKDFEFILLKRKLKSPVPGIKWSENKYSFDNHILLKHILEGKNYGIVGGGGQLRILDIDNKELAEKLLKELNTFAIKTCGGTYHFYFISEYKENHVFKDDLGEFRAYNYYVVGPNCYAVDTKKNHEGLYTIEKDLEIKKLSIEEIKKGNLNVTQYWFWRACYYPGVGAFVVWCQTASGSCPQHWKVF